MATVEKRPLTDEEHAEAARLRQAWLEYKEAHPGATQAWLGAATELGSQGLIGQYLRGIIPLNLRALVSICSQLGVRSEVISPRLMKPFADYTTASTPDEKRARLETLTAVVRDAVGDKNAGSSSIGKGLNTASSEKLAVFKMELAKAEREGQLSEEKLDLLLGVLRLKATAQSPRRHTKARILAEAAPGKVGEKSKREGSG